MFQYLYRGIMDAGDYRLRMEIVQRMMQPRGFHVTIENLNLKRDYLSGMFRVHATLELDKLLAQEISKSQNPWIYVSFETLTC